MGRHGGGSRSGGSRSSSRSSGGSRGGGSSRSTRSSRTPFYGCYNRSYYHRGRYYSYYTEDRDFGKRSGWNFVTIFVLLFVLVHMSFMVGGIFLASIDFGGKVNGDKTFISIEDNANLLSDDDEIKIINLFNRIYEQSGMPIMLYTTDFSYTRHYNSIENYSEDLYYSRTLDEDAMIILFTAQEVDGFYDWNYDMYCGDDTIKCLSDAEFDDVLYNFQKAMYQDDIAEALIYAWEPVIDNLAKIEFSIGSMFFLLLVIPFYGIFLIPILSSVRKENAAYKYFKEHPEELSNDKCLSNINNIKNICPNCKTENSVDAKTCRYCRTSLVEQKT